MSYRVRLTHEVEKLLDRVDRPTGARIRARFDQLAENRFGPNLSPPLAGRAGAPKSGTGAGHDPHQTLLRGELKSLARVRRLIRMSATDLHSIQQQTCLRCGHTWFPRLPGRPKICPECKSSHWNEAKATTGQSIPVASGLATGADSVMRVRGTRVTLDSVVAAFKDGATAEEIAQQYPSVSLADVYEVVGYYLRHSTELELYFTQRQQEMSAARRTNDSRWRPDGIRDRLLARRQR